MTTPEVAREAQITVREVSRPEDLEEVLRIRDEVFVHEQHLTDDARNDPDDAQSVHILAWVGEEPVGTGRLTMFGREAQIAWVAVRRPWRGQGVGRAVMEALIERAQAEGATHVLLNAQTHALDFYRRLGFRTVGTEFVMGGIGHYVMVRHL